MTSPRQNFGRFTICPLLRVEWRETAWRVSIIWNFSIVNSTVTVGADLLRLIPFRGSSSEVKALRFMEIEGSEKNDDGDLDALEYFTWAWLIRPRYHYPFSEQ